MGKEQAGWAWFEDGRDAVADIGSHTCQDLDLPLTVARCFGTVEGRRVLQHLRSITLERSLGPNASDSMLRHLEGQRSLVVYLASLITRGFGSGATDASTLGVKIRGLDPAEFIRSAKNE